MSCQTAIYPAAPVRAFQRKARLARHHIRRIETAKRIVCGEVSDEPLKGLRRDFEKLMVLFDDVFQLLVSGYLDKVDDKELRSELESLQLTNAGVSEILKGAATIGLEGRAPFPALLSKLRENQARMQSQIEGILLSLDDSFQDLLSKSAQALHTSA
jgi:hypothetical protein